MATVSYEDRLTREAEHFDQVYAREERDGGLLLTGRDRQRYAHPPAGTPFSKEYYFHLVAPAPGRSVLEIACGNGVDAYLAAVAGADVSAYDISPAAVNLTRKRAEANGVSQRVQVEVGGDLRTAFAGRQFDVVMGFAALHHLPLAGLGEQIHARLKPGGVAVFAEPVVNSRGLAAFRRLIPWRPAEITDDERPLTDRDIAELARPFHHARRREFECLSRIYPLLGRRRRLVRGLHRLDGWLMKVPPLRRFASVVVFGLYRGE